MLQGWAKVSKREYLQAVRKKGIKGLRLRLVSLKVIKEMDLILLTFVDSERKLLIKYWRDVSGGLEMLRFSARFGHGWVWVVDEDRFEEYGNIELEERGGGFFVFKKLENYSRGWEEGQEEEEEEKEERREKGKGKEEKEKKKERAEGKKNKERKEDDNGLDWLLERF